mmetsp:Transcript_46215/g.144948  ORF Transcript_46215/g.144948 Transcript_46215/m.144948 type:complete len:171 (-) Transcript_46215:3204-3716(-)
MENSLPRKYNWFMPNVYVRPSTTANNFCYPTERQQFFSQLFHPTSVPPVASCPNTFNQYIVGSRDVALLHARQSFQNNSMIYPLQIANMHPDGSLHSIAAPVHETPRVVRACLSPSNQRNSNKSLSVLAHQLKIATQEDLHDRIEQFRLTHAFLIREGASEQDRADAVRI